MLTKHKLAPSYGDATDLLNGSFSVKSEPLDQNSCSQRKRQRLDHLSQEEKVLRRKLKNRVAAQCARDRKKVVMDTLEDEVNTLKIMVKKLETNNQRIQNDNVELQRKNDELQAKFAEIQSQKCNCVAPSEGSSRPLEYAEETGIDSDRLLDVDLGCLDDIGSQQMSDILEELERLLEEDHFALPDGDEQKMPEKQCEPEVVGSTAEQLESIKDLIHLDHIYHKSEALKAPAASEFVSADLLAEVDDTDVPWPIVIENEMPVLFAQGDDGDMEVDDGVVIETETCEVSSAAAAQPCQSSPLLDVVQETRDVDDDDDEVVIVDELQSQHRIPLLSSSLGNSSNAEVAHNRNIVKSLSMTYDVTALLGVPDDYLDADSDYESAGSAMSYRGSSSSDDDACMSPVPSYRDDGIDALRELFPVLI